MSTHGDIRNIQALIQAYAYTNQKSREKHLNIRRILNVCRTVDSDCRLFAITISRAITSTGCSGDHMVLDRKLGIMLMMKSGETPIYKLDIDSARVRISAKYRKKTEPEKVGSSTDYSIETENGSIKVRVYQPVTHKKPGLCYVYYHGGGAVLLSVEEFDSVCRHLCNVSGACVVSVDYHLAPEYRFPVQLNEAITAYKWVINNHEKLKIDSEKVVVIGDSFGGYLATEVAIDSKLNGYKSPCAQILLYPRTDYRRSDLRSYKEYSKGYNLDSEEMEWYWDKYLPSGCNPDDPRICPNRSKDLSGMPRTYIYTAECDPLRDEGEEYANKLCQNGVPTTLVRVEGQVHGFIHFWDILETPKKILEEVATLFNIDKS